MVGGLNYVQSCSVSAWSGCKFNIFVLEWLVGWLAGWLHLMIVIRTRLVFGSLPHYLSVQDDLWLDVATVPIFF